MKFIKGGPSPNPAGRPKGSKTKKSEKVKAFLEDVLTSDLPKLKREFRQLSVKERFRFISDFLPFVLPKLASTSMDVEIEKLSDEQLDDLYNKILKAAS